MVEKSRVTEEALVTVYGSSDGGVERLGLLERLLSASKGGCDPIPEPSGMLGEGCSPAPVPPEVVGMLGVGRDIVSISLGTLRCRVPLLNSRCSSLLLESECSLSYASDAAD